MRSSQIYTEFTPNAFPEAFTVIHRFFSGTVGTAMEKH